MRIKLFFYKIATLLIMTTSNYFTPLNNKERKDLRLLVSFTSVYCRYHHDAPTDGVDIGTEPSALLVAGEYPVCSDCRELLAYAVARRINCPLDPKPVCKHCPVHCYKSNQRQRIKDVMRFSGKHLLLRGRLDLLWHYFF
jgi:hypothetical protein